MTLTPYNPPPLSDGGVNVGPLSQQEYERFRDALPAWRYQLLCMVLRNTGARISEVLALQGRHCFLQGPRYYVTIRRSKRRQKDGDYEALYLRPNVGVQLAHFIKGQNLGPEGPVFAVTLRQVERVFAATGGKALGRKVNPHMMRHLFANDLSEGGVPNLTVSKMLGHSDPKIVLEWYYDVTMAKRQIIGERIQA